MDQSRKGFDIGGNALAGLGIVGFVYLGSKFMDFKNRSKAINAGIQIKDENNTTVEFDSKTKKLKFIKKNEFEVKERKTIIKEVPVVPGFKKTKKVYVELDEKGREIKGTEKDITG